VGDSPPPIILGQPDRIRTSLKVVCRGRAPHLYDELAAIQGWMIPDRAQHLNQTIIVEQIVRCLGRSDWHPCRDTQPAGRLPVSMMIVASVSADIVILSILAASAARSVVSKLEKLEQENVVYAPALAMSLNKQSIRLPESGDRAGGLAAIRRAVDLYEAPAKENFAVYAPDLARSLYVLSSQLNAEDAHCNDGRCRGSARHLYRKGCC
jgi:hypothetical protein